MITAPASRSRETILASYLVDSIRPPLRSASRRHSLHGEMSLIPIGMPWTGPRSLPASEFLIQCPAYSIAPSRSSTAQAWTFGSHSSTCSRQRSRMSTHVDSALAQHPADAGNRLLRPGKQSRQITEELRHAAGPRWPFTSWPRAVPRFRSAVEDPIGDLLHRLLGELLEELGPAGQVELPDQGRLHPAVAPGLAVAEVLGERLARDVGEIRQDTACTAPPAA